MIAQYIRDPYRTAGNVHYQRFCSGTHGHVSPCRARTYRSSPVGPIWAVLWGLPSEYIAPSTVGGIQEPYATRSTTAGQAAGYEATSDAHKEKNRVAAIDTNREAVFVVVRKNENRFAVGGWEP